MSSSPSSSPHHDDIMFRRREKRRHITQQAIDIRDPFSVIALAIRFDESLAVTENDDGARLQVPLETGSLYNQKAFAKALLNLQKQTTASSRLILRKQQRLLSPVDPTGQVPTSPSSSSSVAMTPIILSGLVASIQDRSESDNDDEDDEDNNTGPSAVELVAYCRSMRRAALTRVRLTQRRRKIQRTITPVILLIIVVAMIVWTASKAKRVLYEYGFVGDGGSCQANKACRLAATHIWEYCDPGRRLVIPSCNVDQCDVMEGQLDYPFYSMHTILRPLFMPLSEINNPRKSTSMVRWPYRRQTSTSKQQQSAVQWLGETIVNRLIRETILDYLPSSTPISMLDAGCGVGGTLYAMLDVQNPPSKPFRYHGIAISAPEIYQANLFLTGHHLDTPDAARKTNTEMILFEQRDYDEPLPPQSYSVIVAVESLAHSPNLSHTLQVLANALQKGGILLIVEDVLAPWVSDTRAQDLAHALGKPSLKTYDQWTTVTTSLSNLLEKEVWDLALEFDMSYVLRDPTVDATFFDTIVAWRYQMTRHLAEEVGKRFGGREGDDNHSPLQLMELIKNLSERDLAVRARRQAYRQADFLYYFMIYVKL